MKRKETFTVTRDLVLENSFCIVHSQDAVEMEVTVCTEGDRGWFEMHDVKTEGDEWQAEGGLWMEGKKVVDYDGVFSLPEFVIGKLKSWGYDTTDVEL